MVLNLRCSHMQETTFAANTDGLRLYLYIEKMRPIFNAINTPNFQPAIKEACPFVELGLWGFSKKGGRQIKYYYMR